MKSYNVYKVEVSSANKKEDPKFVISSHLIIAKNEDDVRSNFNPEITGITDKIIRVVKVECLGVVDSFIDDKYKSNWHQKRMPSWSHHEDDGA